MRPRSFLLVLILPALTLLAPSADAKPFAGRMRVPVVAGVPQIIVPAEWGGVWQLNDSTFNCLGVFQEQIVELDTLCSGENVFEAPAELEKFAIDVSCEGDITANSVNVICTGAGKVVEDCLATFTFEMDITRTGETFDGTTTTSFSFEGTGVGCDFLPDQCVIRKTHGTRVAPEPVAFCATPAVEMTWGRMKSRYR